MRDDCAWTRSDLVLLEEFQCENADHHRASRTLHACRAHASVADCQSSVFSYVVRIATAGALLLVRPRNAGIVILAAEVVADGSCPVGAFGKTWAGEIAGGMRMLRAWVRVMGTVYPVEGYWLIGVKPECCLDILRNLVVADV